jgi:hypothetical protein
MQIDNKQLRMKKVTMNQMMMIMTKHDIMAVLIGSIKTVLAKTSQVPNTFPCVVLGMQVHTFF